MAERRMFSKKITESDAFLELPHSAQMLYVHLCMNADDDGFVNAPKKIVKMVEAKKTDLPALIHNAFLIMFDSGVVAIKHWRINNYIQVDRHKKTAYTEELSQLQIKENGAYTLGDGDVANREKVRIPLTPARQKRLEARKESDLPDSFDYKIRHAFLGEICPICLKEMNSFSKKTQPTIQHNVPISKGGKHELSNISVICGECNYSTQDNETGELNNKLVVQKWNEIIGNVSGMDTQNVSGMDTQISIGKNSIGKDRLGEISVAGAREEQSSATATAISLILPDGSYCDIPQKTIDFLKPAYPDLNVNAELLRMRNWLFVNEGKRKPKEEIMRFITGWLTSEQAKISNARIMAQPTPAFATRQYTPEQINAAFADTDNFNDMGDI